MLLGFSDLEGDLASTVRLSERRARLVEQRLKKLGVGAEQAFGLGPLRPVACDGTPAGEPAQPARRSMAAEMTSALRVWVSAAISRAGRRRCCDGCVNPATSRCAYGEHLAQECVSCHRRDGKDIGIPGIFTMSEAEFINAMMLYKTGRRKNKVMVSVTGSLDDTQIRALAIFLTKKQ